VSRLYAPPRNLVLAASAGTGKTHALVGVIVHLLVIGPASSKTRPRPTPPERIVATTFSRKASVEIRARVSAELERLGGAPETSPYMESLRTRLADETSARTTELVTTRARKALAHVAQARFGTLHSFATSIVQSFAVELGLGPGWTLAPEADARARSEEAVARAIEIKLASNLHAVRALAEAAGGIDRLVAELRRILVQLEEDGRSSRDLAISGADAEDIESTMLAFVEHARALSRHPRFAGVARELASAWDTRDEERIARAVIALAAMPARVKSPEVQAFGEFRGGLAGTSNEDRGRRLLRAYRSRHVFSECAHLVRDVLADAETAIAAASRAKAALSFGEILRAARELLRDRPDVANEISSGIDALLVDEFQDTSRVQRDLLELLWAKPAARAAGHVPPLAMMRESGLVVVGDRKQSIYGFRGADVGVFAELAVGLAGEPARAALGVAAGATWQPEEPLADFCALRHNRRSVPEVLAFANAFSALRFCPAEPQPELFEIDYVPSTEDLLVPEERAQATGHAKTPRTTWLEITPKGSTSSRLEEALVIAERIGVLVATNATNQLRVGKDARVPAYRDIAVLATTNAMLDAVAFALAQAEIPYVVAGRSFFRTREVRDLLAMLSLVLDPSDRLAALEVLRGPWAGVHDETLFGLTLPEGGLAKPEHWICPPHPALVREEDRENLGAVAACVSELARCANRLGPGTILRHAVRALSFDAVLCALARGEQRVANVRKLLAIADRHEDARTFRKWLEDASVEEFSESEAATFSEEDDAVRLLTVHASKGLDFPIVFVPEIAAALPPASKGAARVAMSTGNAQNVLAVRIADDAGMILEPPSYAKAYANARRRERAERQRLAYVAVTRAADALFLVGGSSREGARDPGASSLAALRALASDEQAAASACLSVEKVNVPAPVTGHRVGRDDAATLHATNSDARASSPRPLPPAWRSLPIAPTALADFNHCKRRFELVHLLGLPEHVRNSRPDTSSSDVGTVDARTQGILAHAVLERVPRDAFASDAAGEFVGLALAAEGVPVDHPQHAAIAGRVTRFLRGAYAARIASAGADVHREVAFVLDVDDAQGRRVTLRGNMDLVVSWPEGSLDVIDYKSGRNLPVLEQHTESESDAVLARSAGYAFQLDVYVLAARAMFPKASSLRAGLVFLGGGAAEPVWRVIPEEETIRARLASLGAELVHARWSGSFPRTSLDRCKSIYCGFIGRCH